MFSEGSLLIVLDTSWKLMSFNYQFLKYHNFDNFLPSVFSFWTSYEYLNFIQNLLCMADPLLMALLVLGWSRYHYHLHFLDEEIELREVNVSTGIQTLAVLNWNRDFNSSLYKLSSALNPKLQSYLVSLLNLSEVVQLA